MARSQRTKLTLADIGEPAAVKTLPAGQDKFMLGTLVGIASGFTERTSPDKSQKFEGLAGMFRIIPSDTNRDELESGILFVPDAFHNLIAEKLRAAQGSDPKAEIRFAFEISSIRANNPAGYSWDFMPVIENEGENPLDQLVAALPASTIQAIEDKSAARNEARKGGNKRR